MKKLIVLCLVAGLSACGSSQQSSVSAPAPATTAARGAAMANDEPNQLVPPTSAGQMSAQRIRAVVSGAWRPSSDKARDRYRHPVKTLEFFGIRPDMTVIEITPGGGWYTRILAPFLRDNGQYIAAEFTPRSGKEAQQDDSALKQLLDSKPGIYGKARIIQFDPTSPVLGPPGSADMVLTFRNAHNWVQAGTAKLMFKAFFAVLKPGGVLGVVDHRAATGATLDQVKGSGYLPQSAVIQMAEKAGFTLQASSDINANPEDTRDYPKGVWTLPPTLALGNKDKVKYEAIGESDRMTLRFVKPTIPSDADTSSGG
ncbi:methyltransferase [Oleiagrimonas sp.]|jgi:predicted methyltransferase|uniref:class I SAM-dependent methyltransferase n=1 Tax=Oleiagrimonas sp. TaxID=2010330 RepID=UPI0026055CF8|nr:methyltransferase [Oleiagrimonas sp.]MDA3913337.1 methyltransferase [Oleiagrimonas sp.]